MKPMSRYSISILCLLMTVSSLFAQKDEEQTADAIKIDSIGFQEKYGLRFGIDLSRLGRTAFETDYSGFEVNADYRLGRRLYLAGELGFEEKSNKTNYLETSAKGSYFKAGVDFNLYNNWLGMENLITSGLRVGISSFSQTRERFTIYDTNSQTWGELQNNDREEFSDLSAAWAELIFGIKAEVLNNVFLGFNVQIKARLSEKSPSNFENIFIPGFGRTYDSSKVGTGFNYTLSYLLPIYKKARSKKETPDETEPTIEN